jgi:hypothetical protein
VRRRNDDEPDSPPGQEPPAPVEDPPAQPEPPAPVREPGPTPPKRMRM